MTQTYNTTTHSSTPMRRNSLCQTSLSMICLKMTSRRKRIGGEFRQFAVCQVASTSRSLSWIKLTTRSLGIYIMEIPQLARVKSQKVMTKMLRRQSWSYINKLFNHTVRWRIRYQNKNLSKMSQIWGKVSSSNKQAKKTILAIESKKVIDIEKLKMNEIDKIILKYLFV